MAGAVPVGNPVAWMRGDTAPGRGPESAHHLIAAAQSGDTAAFGRLVELHQQRVFRTARAILGNDADAQDAAQEAFLRAYRHFASFDPKRDLAAWLYKLTVNVCRDMVRRRPGTRTCQTETEALATGDPGPFEAAALQEQRDLTRRAIARLPYKERVAITLRDLEGLSTAEVAAALGTTQATVRSQVSAARAKLRRYILGGRRSQT
ncbi:MAG: sigma-70 family RNA polymerase sigma factor [Bryobacterales bacterium]|nr:sigma-70 family RNA polymerase sigma factor [Bryobacterales bacterium]MDE0261803.1 sigma-70 family RNA polymerase sigma factor [Bryobacterales bacterium]MDE0623801.1 sigma-70 family RNA polymerase sigma factor [Bryobacterales bacterium]